MVALNQEDPSKSCLLDGKVIARISDALADLLKDAEETSAGCTSDQGLTAVVVLSSLSSAAMPELVSVALDTPMERLPPLPPPETHPDPAEAAKARHKKVNVKKEPDHGDKTTVKAAWTKAYDSFLRMIADKKRTYGLHKTDFTMALPQIEGIIRIAQLYHAMEEVRTAFSSLLVGYVEHHTLYLTIAKEPVRCLNVGIALQSRLVYDEAFKHLVGNAANFKAEKTFDSLSDNVHAIIQRRARNLYNDRMHVMMDLMSITLTTKRSHLAPDYPTKVVSQHQRAESYCVVNIFRDWMSEHIGYLRSETDRETTPSYLCAHETGCTTVAGFFRTVMAGGDSYLPAEKFMDDWDANSIELVNARDTVEDTMKQSLAGLKVVASGYVKKLVCSELQLRDRDDIQYLTCVKVGSEDRPWVVESDEDSDEEMYDD